MSYAVKEIFLTLQGEGVHTGRRAVFLRFAGCNLWSGREQDRSSAVCRFCDTDFVGTDGEGGGKLATPGAVAETVAATWGSVVGGTPYVVITGGEPLLQLDAPLIDALHTHGFEIGVETNGTIPAPPGIDWLCVSPKAGSKTVQRSGNELKLVWPQPGSDAGAMSGWAFDHFLIQPMDGPELAANRAACIDFILANPKWRLATQTHKILGIA
jgi:7-carboxy-7-deazaguanine synthase (Cx14CxxC type)